LRLITGMIRAWAHGSEQLRALPLCDRSTCPVRTRDCHQGGIAVGPVQPRARTTHPAAMPSSTTR
jgi:hypothetical protein